MQEETITEVLLDGRYRLHAVVGRGGMATVYRAEDVLLGRTVAIKMIRPDGDVAGSADRAHVEKAALASLDHGSLVTLFDSQLDPGRAQYLVMEYVDGPTLAARLSRGPLAPTEAARLARDLAEALDAVHAAGLIHRDVKPANVLLKTPAREGAPATAMLADFGIACAVGASRLTSPGVVLGTVTYMAPEQLRGAELTPAVDVYALGLLLIEALTGAPAYASGNSIESALVRLTVAPEIPDGLDASWRMLLRRMTAIDPADRLTSREVAAVADRLSRVDTVSRSVAPAVVPPAVPAATTTRATMPIPPLGRRARRRRAAVSLRRRVVGGVAAACALAAIAAGTLAAAIPADGPVPRIASAVGAKTPSTTDPVVQEDAVVQPAIVDEPSPTRPGAGEGSPAHADNGKEPSHAHGPGGRRGQRDDED